MRLYVTNSLGDDITVIDLATLRVVDDIKVGKHVHGIAAPTDGRRLFVTIESERNLKVIDTATDQVTDIIPLTGRPNLCASTPDGRFVAVPIRDGNSVDIVDTTQHKVVRVLPVQVQCADLSPTGTPGVSRGTAVPNSPPGSYLASLRPAPDYQLVQLIASIEG
jgi:YVTN family beta-propeller protein